MHINDVFSYICGIFKTTRTHLSACVENVGFNPLPVLFAASIDRNHSLANQRSLALAYFWCNVNNRGKANFKNSHKLITLVELSLLFVGLFSHLSELNCCLFSPLS